MSKLTGVIFLVVASLFVIACMSCDDYNIVEPRFYDEDDLVEFADCGRDPFVVEPIDGAGDTIGIVQPKLIPANYDLGACWYTRAEGRLAVAFALPQMSSLKLSVLNSGSGIEAVLFEGVETAGYYVVPWVVEEDGVYAISAQTEGWTEVIWFEVKWDRSV